MTAPGWYPVPTGGQRYFDGTNWTSHVSFTDAERADRLGAAVAYEVARGWRVESLSSYQAVLVSGQQMNNVAHLLGVLVTCGIWFIGWIIALAMAKPETRLVLRVDAHGNVIRG
jgi:hypothetical protein